MFSLFPKAEPFFLSFLKCLHCRGPETLEPILDYTHLLLPLSSSLDTRLTLLPLGWLCFLGNLIYLCGGSWLGLCKLHNHGFSLVGQLSLPKLPLESKCQLPGNKYAIIWIGLFSLFCFSCLHPEGNCSELENAYGDFGVLGQVTLPLRVISELLPI